MTKTLKILLCATLSFMFVFLMVGYAALTDNLSILGRAKIAIPEGLFITEVKATGTSNMQSNSASYVPYSTTMDVTMNKSSSGNGWWGVAGSVTYQVTVFNNTDLEYAYRGIYYQPNLSGYNGNSSISNSNGNNSIGVVCSLANASAASKKVAPGGTLTFTVTYTVGRNMSDVDYKTLINYQFGINVETEEEAREAVYSKFEDILNTSTTYENLIDNIDNKFDGYNEWTSNYIGNVGDATTDDSMAVNTLFAGQLSMIINGDIREARVIIKHENIDNNTMTGDDYVATNESNGGVFRGYGCEMTMYFTVDPLSTPNGSAEVFVSVYTCDRDENGNITSDWYRIGDTYVGTAPIVSYNGTAGGTGSFVTDNWRSTYSTYSPTEKFTYTVSGGQTIKSLVQLVDSNATAEFSRLIAEAKAMIDDLTYAGTGIDIVERAYVSASKYFTVDENGNHTVKSGVTRAQLCPILSELDHALVEAQKEIDEILGKG